MQNEQTKSEKFLNENCKNEKAQEIAAEKHARTKSLTALISAFARAYHYENSQNPVFCDFAAKKLFTAEEYEQIKGLLLDGSNYYIAAENAADMTEKQKLDLIVDYYLSPNPLCRAKWAERALKIAMRSGVKNYVILGAGFDTFAQRNPDFLKRAKIFEADHPLMQKNKIERLIRAGYLQADEVRYISENVMAAGNLRFAGADFSIGNLMQKLISAGLSDKRERLGEKTFFSWLGVTYYLDKEQIEKTLAQISELCAAGDSVAFDYPCEGFFNASETRVQKTIETAAASGEPMKSCFGYSELEKMLENHGFLIYELLTPEDIFRDIIKASGSDMNAFEHVNYCLAVKKHNYLL